MEINKQTDDNLHLKEDVYDLDKYVTDGIYVLPSNGVIYDLRAAIKRVEELGRTLTDEELEELRLR